MASLIYGLKIFAFRVVFQLTPH
jgi:hypothetical protein